MLCAAVGHNAVTGRELCHTGWQVLVVERLGWFLLETAHSAQSVLAVRLSVTTLYRFKPR